MANSADLSSWVVSIETMGEIRIELRIGEDIGLNIRTESHFITSLTGKTASLALLTLRESVIGVCPLGIELLRLYLFSSDVILLLPSSDEDTSVLKRRTVITLSNTFGTKRGTLGTYF